MESEDGTTNTKFQETKTDVETIPNQSNAPANPSPVPQHCTGNESRTEFISTSKEIDLAKNQETVLTLRLRMCEEKLHGSTTFAYMLGSFSTSDSSGNFKKIASIDLPTPNFEYTYGSIKEIKIRFLKVDEIEAPERHRFTTIYDIKIRIHIPATIENPRDVFIDTSIEFTSHP